MLREDCVEVGFIAKAHGIKGELKAVFDVYDLREYRKKKRFFLGKDDKPLLEYKLKQFAPIDKFVLLAFEGIEDRDQAETLVGYTLFSPLAELPTLPEGRFYYFELIGFTVEDARYGTLGIIREFIELGAQELLSMEYQGRDVLIPTADHFLLRADKENKILYTALPEGLVELYLEP